MTDTEQQEMKEENAKLLREKADAVAQWQEEVRRTLKKHTEDLAVISHNTDELPHLRTEINGLKERVKDIEDFKLKAVAAMSTAFALLAAAWKLIDKLWS